jgi:hypothetical protein
MENELDIQIDIDINKKENKDKDKDNDINKVKNNSTDDNFDTFFPDFDFLLSDNNNENQNYLITQNKRDDLLIETNQNKKQKIEKNEEFYANKKLELRKKTREREKKIKKNISDEKYLMLKNMTEGNIL